MDPSTSSTLYAGTGGVVVFKSINGGSSWNAVNTGLTNLTIRALVIDPSVPTTLYAGTNGRGVYKSIDGAATWQPTNASYDQRKRLGQIISQ